MIDVEGEGFPSMFQNKAAGFTDMPMRVRVRPDALFNPVFNSAASFPDCRTAPGFSAKKDFYQVFFPYGIKINFKTHPGLGNGHLEKREVTHSACGNIVAGNYPFLP